jgi:hypothetical protein
MRPGLNKHGIDRIILGVVIAVIVVIVAGIVIKFPMQHASNNLFVSLTDPYITPSGTQSVSISYSSLQVHTVNGNNSGWVTVGGSGTVNLTSLINVSQLIAAGTVSNGSLINLVRFNISSASIKINNTVNPVFVPSSSLVVNVNRPARTSGNSSLLVSVTPVVVTLFTVNSTLFVLVPSLRAIYVPGLGFSGGSDAIGHTEIVSTSENNELTTAAPNISISAASLSSSSNNTSLSFSLKDESNQSVIIRQILVLGNTSVNGSAVGENLNASAGNDGVHGSDSPKIEHEQEMEQEQSGVVHFLVQGNGSLFLPTSEAEFEHAGYFLAPLSTESFSFSGKLILGESSLSIVLTAGKVYTLVVLGENGAKASYNVTAS